MDTDNKRPFAIVSSLSGKGGSGKTTSFLALAKILSDVGFKTLLIDLDLATSGASFFFSPMFAGSRQKGVVDILEAFDKENVERLPDAFLPDDTIILPINEKFDFIPSRTIFGKPISLTWTVLEEDKKDKKNNFLCNVIKMLINGVQESYDYILIDNQAGYTETSIASVLVSTKAVIISEADRISSDAVDNLVGMISSYLPSFRTYLINKVEIREVGDYLQKVDAYKAINRLPPLPFDFSVRKAFGEREIPVDLQNPTPFLIALFATAKEIFPENKKRFQKYENEKVKHLFDSYQIKLDELIVKRNEIRDRIVSFEALRDRRIAENKIFNFKLFSTISGLIGFFTLLYVTFIVILNTPTKFTGSVIISTFILAITSSLMVVFKKRSKVLSEFAKLEEERTKKLLLYQQQMAESNKEVERYKNLIVTRSSDLLIDFDKLSAG